MFNGEKIRLGKSDAAHLYTLAVLKDGIRGEIDVEATNRSQASRIAEKAGYEVGSVNMVG